jgi:hypothetical protein
MRSKNKVKLIEAESRMVALPGAGGGNEEVLVKGHKVSVTQMKKF